MSKTVRLSVSTPTSTISNKPDQRVVPVRSGKSYVRKIARKFDLDELFPIALSSGIGLLISLVAILFGVQGGRS